MRKVWTVLLLVLLVSAALVVPAAAAKPVKPQPPAGLKVTVETIDDTIKEWMPWIAAVGDKVNYRVTVANGGAPVIIEEVTDVLADTDLVCVSSGGCTEALGTGSAYVYLGLHEVTVDEYAQDELVNVVTVRPSGLAAIEVTSTMTIGHYTDCEGNLDGTYYGPNSPSPCRWQPAQPGLWSIKLTSEEVPRPITVTMSLRDHIPGNWCKTPEGEGGVVTVRKWRGGTVELLVYLPANGVCLEGGHGGELYGDGNADHYYFNFNVNGYIKATWISSG